MEALPLSVPPLGIPGPYAASLLIVAGVTGHLTLTHLWLGLARRTDPLHWWVALCGLAALVYPLARYLTYLVRDTGQALWLSRVQWTCAMLLIPLAIGFLHAVTGAPLRRRALLRLGLGISPLVALEWGTPVFTSSVVQPTLDLTGQPYFAAPGEPLSVLLIPIMAWAFVHGARVVRRAASLEAPERRILLVGLVVYLLVGLWEIARTFLTGLPSVFAFGFMGLVLSLDHLLARRSSRLYTGLEEAVAERTHALAEKHAALEQSHQELERLNAVFFEHARVDPLTQVGNRRRLEEDLQTVHSQAARSGAPYGLALFDVDLFKAYNDTLGHAAGDVVLAAVARTLRNACREGDSVYRYGGEEFLVILPGQGPAAALAAAGRLRVAVAHLAIPHPASSVAPIVTVSAGVAAYQGAGGPGEVLRRADRALYSAKQAGRDCVHGTPLTGDLLQQSLLEARPRIQPG